MMPLPPQVPRRGGGISRRVAAALLRLLGWRVAGSVPDVAKCVVVAVPHTSNFDGLYVLPALLALDLKMSIFGKKSLFAVPGLAAFLRWAGVMPLDRERAGGRHTPRCAQMEKRLLADCPRRQCAGIAGGDRLWAARSALPAAVYPHRRHGRRPRRTGRTVSRHRAEA